MKYRGFREDTLLAAVRELEALGLKPAEAYAVMNLAGAKWRSVQIRESRGDEFQDEADSLVFHEATVGLMKTTMTETQQLAKLGHSTEGERFMLLGISLAMNRLFARGPSSIRDWLGEGDNEARKAVLAFAMGSYIIVEPQVIDLLMRRIVKLRYGSPFDAGRDISESVLAVVERLGTSGYSCLKPMSDSLR
jgi:hypothetical protein